MGVWVQLPSRVLAEALITKGFSLFSLLLFCGDFSQPLTQTLTKINHEQNHSPERVLFYWHPG